MGVGLKINGLDAALKKMQGMAGEAEKKINDSFAAFGLNVETTAKTLAPADEGRLRNAISSKRKQFGVEIVCAVNYAAFMEFGTRQYAAKYVATLPQDWQQYAATFKGGGSGTFDELLSAIMSWVKRNEIDDELAYHIAKMILIIGLRPRPFLYPAVVKHIDQLKKDLQNIIQ